MNEALFIDFALKTSKSNITVTAPSEEDLKLINGMKKNGPLRNMTADDIQTRSICIMGEEPTSKLSIHPEGDINGRKINSLSRLAFKLPGAPMMVGHCMDKAPWGRTFKAEVLDLPGFTGKVVKEGYFFFNDSEGIAIGNKIDAGIWAEGSISYWFKEARCSICHKTMARGWDGAYSNCEHKLGVKDEASGQICYWYPDNILDVAETSYVFKGAYEKTKSMLNSSDDELVMAYSADAIDGGKKLEEQLCNHGFDNLIESEENDGNEDSGTEQESTIPPQITTNKTDNADSKSGNDSHGSNQAGGEENSESTELSAEEQTASDDAGGTEHSDENTKTPASRESSSDNADDNADRNESDTGRENNQDSESEYSQSSKKTLGSSESTDQGSSLDEDANATTEKECTCPSCGHKQNVAKGKPCSDVKCEKCKTPLEGEGCNNAENIDTETSKGADETGNTDPGTKDAIGDNVNKTLVSNESQNCDLSGENSKNGENTKENADSEENGRNNATGDDQSSENASFESEESDSEESSEADSVSNLNIITDEIMSIIHDRALDSDEKETALREELIAQPEQLLEALDALSAIAVNDPVVSYTGECAVCATKEHLDSSEAIICPDCEKAMAVRENHVHRPFTIVGALRVKKNSVVNHEEFKKESFRDLPDGILIVEPNYDGLWMEMHKRGGAVKLFDENGTEQTEKFLGLTKEAAALAVDNFILVGEVVKFRGRQRGTYDDVSAWVNGDKDEYDDKLFKFKISDIVVKNNVDVSGEAYGSRRKYLDTNVKFGKQVQPTAITRVDHKKGEGNIVKAIDDRSTREGARIMQEDHRYSQKDSNKLHIWKRQFELDCKVLSRTDNEGGEFTYTCEVGRGTATQKIGETFSSKIDAKDGQILQVSVDLISFNEEDSVYSWTAPKVVALRLDKVSADPLSTIKKMVTDKPVRRDTNVITLTEVIPKLKQADVPHEFFLIGGLVEHGMTAHDIDIIVCNEITEEFTTAVTNAIGKRLAPYLNIVYEEAGPAGPNIPIYADLVDKGDKPVRPLANQFVIQRHGWGNKEHFDIRFGSKRSDGAWGWTCFTKPSTKAGPNKTRCQEKLSHESSWMNVDKKSISVGHQGNPTKNQKAHMIKEDHGDYEFVRRTDNYLEVILHGEEYNGRYIWREIDVKSPVKKMAAESAILGDETGVKNETLWVMWKPNDQETNNPVKKIAFKMQGGCLMYWETDENDSEIANAPNLNCE